MFAIYVSNAESGDISVLRLDPASGAIAPVQTVEPGGELMPMALGPSRDRLYVARRSEPREALSFAIDRRSGRLSPLGNAALPHSMAYIASDRSGRWLLSASYGGDLVAVNAIDAQGIVGATVQTMETPRHAHAIEADESNREVLVCCLGGHVVLRFGFDAQAGSLAFRAATVPHHLASPRHLRLGPDGRFAYLLNELDGLVDVLARERDGSLRTVQSITSLAPGLDGAPWCADIQLTPDGRFLYTSERRGSQLTGFRIDPATGLLAPIGYWATELQPRGFAITPDGRWLLSVGQRSERLSLFAIDAANGRLTRHGEAPVGRGPNWIECITLVTE